MDKAGSGEFQGAQKLMAGKNRSQVALQMKQAIGEASPCGALVLSPVGFN